MNMRMISLVLLPVFIVATTAPAQEILPNLTGSNYSRNPLTPGYGISDYFELMPDKVGIIRTRKSDVVIHHTPAISASILRGKTIIIQADGVKSASKFTVAIHTPAGRRVWGKDGFLFRSGNQSLTLAIPRVLPNGIYFISIAGTGLERRIFRVVVAH
jgi:hypothetical protein